MSAVEPEASHDEPDIRTLTYDLDVEVCVIGGGLAGLSVALEAATMGASVALLEAGRVGQGASGRQLGAVKTGFDVSAASVIGRIGRRSAAELWRMSQTGVEIVRAHAASMPNLVVSEGALEVASHAPGERILEDVLELGAEFGLRSERWDRDRLRAALDTKRYFTGLYHSNAFQVDSEAYLKGLASLARQAGVRIFEDTPALAMDASGARKRIVTPAARLRAAHLVLAGNVHPAAVMPRLTATLLPVWRYGALTAPLDDHARVSIGFTGAIADTDGVDHFRLRDDGRLLWSSLETTWEGRASRGASAIRRRIARIFPTIGMIAIDATFSGAVGQTVHGMPQIGQVRPGLWVASGFGRQGMNTAAMAGRIIAQAILLKDDRWRLFAPFDLIWAGGRTGRVAGYAIGKAARSRATVLSAWARRRETAQAKARTHDLRVAAAIDKASKSAPVREADTLSSPDGERATLPPSPFLQLNEGSAIGPPDMRSRESEHTNGASA